MKYLVAILLLAFNFMPAEFHPIDEIISLELADLTGESSKTLIDNRTKTYDGDLVSVSVENNGGFDEYIGFQVYLPEQVDLMEFNSKSSGPKVNQLNSKKSTSTPLQLASLTDDDIQVQEMQTASTRTGLRSGNKIDFIFNYEAENIESKQTNQFLAVLDVYSDNPDQLKVKLNSANFGHGNYPDASKHRWLIRTHAGYSLSLDVEKVDMEKDLDTVTVYDVHSSGTKKLVSEVNVAKQLDTSTNQMLVVFKSDCSVNREGFSAIVNVVKGETPITTEAPLTTTPAPTCGIPSDLENGYFIISDGDEIAKDNVNVTYYCNENYRMANQSVATFHCFDGSFEPSYIDASLYCQPDPIWSDWEEGMCSEACNGGSRTDTRLCIHGNCEGDSRITVDCNNRGCEEAAVTCGSGVQDRSKIKDNQISASSYHHKGMNTHHQPRHGRLFGTSGVAAWMAGQQDQNPWIQVDYLKPVEMSGVATQGRGDGEAYPGNYLWVTKYTVSYKTDENGSFQFVVDDNGAPIVFGGNSDKDTVVAHQFPHKMRARYFRINPTKINSNINLRFEFLTC